MGGVNIFSSAITAAITRRSPSVDVPGVSRPSSVSAATGAVPVQSAQRFPVAAKSASTSTSASAVATHQPQAPVARSSAAGLFDDGGEDGLFCGPRQSAASIAFPVKNEVARGIHAPTVLSPQPTSTKNQSIPTISSGGLFSSDEDDLFSSGLLKTNRINAEAIKPASTVYPPAPAPSAYDPSPFVASTRVSTAHILGTPVKSTLAPTTRSQAPTLTSSTRVPSIPTKKDSINNNDSLLHPKGALKKVSIFDDSDDDLFGSTVSSNPSQKYDQTSAVQTSSPAPSVAVIISRQDSSLPNRQASTCQNSSNKIPIISDTEVSKHIDRNVPQQNKEQSGAVLVDATNENITAPFKQSISLFSSGSDDDLFSSSVLTAKPSTHDFVPTISSVPENPIVTNSTQAQNVAVVATIAQNNKEICQIEPKTAKSPQAPVIAIPVTTHPSPVLNRDFFDSSGDEQFLFFPPPVPSESEVAADKSAFFGTPSSDEEVFPSVSNAIGYSPKARISRTFSSENISVADSDKITLPPAIYDNFENTLSTSKDSTSENINSNYSSKNLTNNNLHTASTAGIFSSDDDIFGSPQKSTGGITNVNNFYKQFSTISEISSTSLVNKSRTISEPTAPPSINTNSVIEDDIFDYISGDDMFARKSSNVEPIDTKDGLTNITIANNSKQELRSESVAIGSASFSSPADILDGDVVSSAAKTPASDKPAAAKKPLAGSVALFGGAELLAKVGKRRQVLENEAAQSVKSVKINEKVLPEKQQKTDLIEPSAISVKPSITRKPVIPQPRLSATLSSDTDESPGTSPKKKPVGGVALFGGAELFAKLKQRQSRLSSDNDESPSASAASTPSEENKPYPSLLDSEHGKPPKERKRESFLPAQPHVGPIRYSNSTVRPSHTPVIIGENASSFEKPASAEVLSSLSKVI